ncbi:MAG: hypothetical protein V2I33_14160 [Kangiellaceae bacterium]|jgi:hypothetical protein|nr:hypothetical protein [Kangiellaceae bacterium]
MPYQDKISSLSLISEHIDEMVTAIIEAIVRYHNGDEAIESLQEAKQKSLELNRVFSFIELNAADQMVADIADTIDSLPNSYEESLSERLEAVSYCLTMLQRYIGFIIEKPIDLPQLLLEPINELRRLNQLPDLPESMYFSADHLKVRQDFEKDEHLDRYDIAKVSRRLRQMYQVGLIEVIRKTNIHGGLGMMLRALERLDKQCGSPLSSNLWWIASGVLIGFDKGGLVISKGRIKYLSQIDLQIRELGYADNSLKFKAQEQANQLCFELLYLVNLSDDDSELTTSLKKHFGLTEQTISERTIVQEFLLLTGLNNQDYQALYQTILDDVLNLQTEVIADEFEAESDEINALNNRLNQFKGMFNMLQIEELEQQTKSVIEGLDKDISAGKALSDDNRQAISECLATIEQELSGQAKSQESSQLKRSQLTPEQKQAYANARKEIHITNKQIEQYTQKDFDVDLLQSVPSTLTRISLELHKVEEQQVINAIDQINKLFEGYFLKRSSTMQAIEFLADILCGIEFYLETKESQHIPSKKSLEFVDEGVAKLTTYLNL